ncbi:MAG: elongation factor P maturation arginine rhamnosyltransferase EarP, partial [Treponemataceae bacterium]|nr:elongation factor P maturation arginine rhamnosyltransferase EarP [Treponemataceae bacterium]
APFLSAWERAGKPFAAEPLPFLPQETWDALLCAADWNFVRGEDSLSRACLAGVPFVWQPYPQDEDYHIVKLAALNERLRPFFSPDAFAAYDAYTRDYALGKDSADSLLRVLSFLPQLRKSFAAFADYLIANGDLADHLLGWLDTLHNPSSRFIL